MARFSTVPVIHQSDELYDRYWNIVKMAAWMIKGTWKPDIRNVHISQYTGTRMQQDWITERGLRWCETNHVSVKIEAKKLTHLYGYAQPRFRHIVIAPYTRIPDDLYPMVLFHEMFHVIHEHDGTRIKRWEEFQAEISAYLMISLLGLEYAVRVRNYFVFNRYFRTSQGLQDVARASQQKIFTAVHATYGELDI